MCRSARERENADQQGVALKVSKSQWGVKNKRGPRHKGLAIERHRRANDGESRLDICLWGGGDRFITIWRVMNPRFGNGRSALSAWTTCRAAIGDAAGVSPRHRMRDRDAGPRGPTIFSPRRPRSSPSIPVRRCPRSRNGLGSGTSGPGPSRIIRSSLPVGTPWSTATRSAPPGIFSAPSRASARFCGREVAWSSWGSCADPGACGI